MRLKLLVREACLNVTNGVAGYLWLAVALSIVTTTAAVGSIALITQTYLARDAFVDAGATTYIVTAPNSISGRACEALASANDGGGALSPFGNASFGSTPGAQFTQFTASPEWLATYASGSGAGIYPAAQMATDLGLSPGESTYFGGATEVAGEYRIPAGTSRPDLEYAVLSPASADALYSECWVVATAGATAFEYADLLRSSLLPSALASEVEVAQLNSRLGEGFDLDRELATTPSPFVVAAAGVLALTISCFSFVRRRVHLAQALHLGAMKIDVVAQQMVEGIVVFALSMALSTPVIAMALAVSSSLSGEWSACARVGLACLGSVAAGTGIAAIAIAGAVRRDHLVQLFINRA